MYNISQAFKGNIKPDGDIEDYISSQIRGMKRLWEGKGLNGLLKRRDREADLISSNKKKLTKSSNNQIENDDDYED